MSTPYKQIRARFDAQTIVVYQAFNDAIADAALEAQRFVRPFSLNRMTWVKPSFLWMMERCGWATKPNQESSTAPQRSCPSRRSIARVSSMDVVASTRTRAGVTR